MTNDDSHVCKKNCSLRSIAIPVKLQSELHNVLCPQLFGVDPIRSSKDRASVVEGLPDGVLIMMWYCGERYFVPLGKVSWCRVGGLLIFKRVAGR